MGNVEAARAIEPLCILWCIPDLEKPMDARFQAFKKIIFLCVFL